MRFELKDLIALFTSLARLALLDYSHIEQGWVKHKVASHGSESLANLQSLNLLGVHMGLEHDVLTVSYQLLDFEGAHHSLDILVLYCVHSADFVHVITVLFANVCPILRFFFTDRVKHGRHQVGHILTEFQSNILYHGGAEDVCSA